MYQLSSDVASILIMEELVSCQVVGKVCCYICHNVVTPIIIENIAGMEALDSFI